MRRYRGLVGALCLWAMVMGALALMVADGQQAEREALLDRFQNRADTGADFVAAYVDDVFDSEERLASLTRDPDWDPAEFPAASEFLGFSAAVLLDEDGRAAAVAPAAPALLGDDLAAEYPHLREAFDGRRSVSDIVPSAASGERTVAFVLPIDAGPYAVLSSAFNLTEGPLGAFLERQPIPGTHASLLDSNGEVIVSAGDGAPLARKLLRRLQDASDEALVAEDRVLAASAVPGTGWTYVVDAPRATLLAPATANNASSWVVLVLTGLLTLAGLVWADRLRRVRASLSERLRLTVEHAPVGMTMADLDRRFMEPNTRYCAMLGYTADELCEMRVEDVTHPDDLHLDLEQLERLTTGEIDSYEIEKRYRRKDGTLLWARLSVSAVRGRDGKPAYFVRQVEDVTELRAARSQLQQRALYDPLTGVANRSLLMDRLAIVLGHERGVANVGLCFCDLDHFKQINDTYGHHTGDDVLKVVARRLQEAVRGEDTVARLGGDEFVILLHDVRSLEDAKAVMARATALVKAPIKVGGTMIRTSLSGGLAIAPAGSDPDVLLRDADAAMYAAKKAGRGRIEVHAGSRFVEPDADAASPQRSHSA